MTHAPIKLTRANLDYLLLEQDRRKYRKLINFVEDAWEILEPSEPYRGNWHINVICEHLEAVTRGDIKNLLINIPPGCMKSLLVSVIWPAWEWRENQALRYFCASYGEDISIRDNLKCRDLIKSEWYQRLWPDVQIRRDNDQKSQYGLTGGGSRMASSVGGRGTGHHPDRKIVDDPHNVRQSESDTERNGALSWFDRTLSSRGASRGAATIVIMQRLHEKDLSGHIMEMADYKTDWVHLCLPMEYDGERSKTSLGLRDPRTEVGELLWPSLYPKKVVETLAMRLGEYGAAGQLQQRPSPAGGGIIKTDKFELWPADKDLPDLIYVLQSYDTAFTAKTTNDPTACTVWGIFEYKKERCVLLLDSWSEHLEYPKLRTKVIDDWHAKYGGVKDDQMHPARRADAVLIEEKGSGISLIQDLRRARIPVLTYNPGRADKISRAHQVTPIIDIGVVYILESRREADKPITWARAFLQQCEQFPNGEHDDYCLVGETLISMADGSNKRLDSVNVGDFVLTSNGIGEVTESRFTGIREIWEVEFSDGTILRGTHNHPVFANGDWINLSQLKHGMICVKAPIKNKVYAWLSNLLASAWKWLSLMGTDTGAIQMQKRFAIENTSLVLGNCSIGQYGNITMEPFQMDMISTTSMVMCQITGLRIWNALQEKSICENTPLKKLGTADQRLKRRIWIKLGRSLQNGIGAKLGGSGIAKTLRDALKKVLLGIIKESPRQITAFGAKGSTFVIQIALNFVRRHAKQKNQELVSVKDVLKMENYISPVFNLTIDGAHSYYANGILTHNCDSFSQALIYLRDSNMLELPEADEDEIEDIDYHEKNKVKRNPYDV